MRHAIRQTADTQALLCFRPQVFRLKVQGDTVGEAACPLQTLGTSVCVCVCVGAGGGFRA